MAKKISLLRYIVIPLLYMVINILMSFLLLLLQYKCMSQDSLTFVNGYCLGNNEMRAVVSAIITVMIFVIGATTSNAINSYRTYKLVHGIKEGIFVALAGDPGYRWKSMKTKWKYVILLILIFQCGPQLLQILSNLAIKTVRIYVRNDSTVSIYDGYSYYNTTTVSIPVPTLHYAMDFVSKVIPYTTGKNSMPVYTRPLKKFLGVETLIIRNGFIGNNVTILNNDLTNSIEHDEVIAKVYTSCVRRNEFYNNTLSQLMSYNDNIFSPIHMLNTSLIFSFINKYEIKNKNVVTFNTTRPTFYCNITNTDNCTLAKSIFTAFDTIMCNTQISVALYKIIYTLGTDNIQIIKHISNDTSVNIDVLSKLIVNYTTSIEQEYKALYNSNSNARYDYAYGMILIYHDIPVGLFNDVSSNEIHSRYCAATSLALQSLWYFYNKKDNYMVLDNITNLVEYLNSGNSITKYKPYYLHSVKLQAYMPLYNAYAISISVIAVTLLIIITDVVYFIKSPINIKSTNELCLIDNVDNKFRHARRTSHLSNDPNEQQVFAFSGRKLYCNEEEYIEGTRRLVVNYDNNGYMPQRNIDYL